jgi:transcriptional regulator with XRE-family HTH domain
VAAVTHEILLELGLRLRKLRQVRGVSLESLATSSGVSRSMISDIERSARAPTVLVLARLATALGTTVSRLLGEERPDRVILIRQADQNVITESTGWQRRVLSPTLPDVEFEFIRTCVPAHVVIGQFAPHVGGSREYVAVEAGDLTVSLDGVDYQLSTGDSLYYAADITHAFANTGDAECVYYTAMHIAGLSHDQRPREAQ